MRRVVLITGGSRSGKSSYALQIGEELDGPRTFVATCPVVDEEMEKRIQKHKDNRDPKLWETIEEEENLIAAIERCKEYSVILIDCLTLWINNITQHGEALISEEEMEERCKAMLEECQGQNGTIIFVSNELGMGIVPSHPATRQFRDLVGRCNQTISKEADQVVFMISGNPLKVKG